MKKILLYSKPWNMAADVDYNYPIDDFFEMTTERRYLSEAVAVIFHMPTLPEHDGILDKKNKKAGQLWVFWSMECELHYSWQYVPAVQELFDIRITYRCDSDIPTPYVYPDHYEALKSAPADTVKEHLINAFISSDFDKSNRRVYLQELMSYLDVHSYGKVLNNRSLQNDNGTASKLDVMSKYKFTIAFENAIAQDYVTEKFFDPLEAGSVPVYLGAPNVADFAPGDHCYIDVRDYPSPRALADYLLKVAADDTLYSHFSKWRKAPYKQQFLSKIEIGRRDPLQRLTERIKDKLNEHKKIIN